MIVTELYNGQGLGNQIWNLIVLRIVAEKHGYEWGTKRLNPFKGRDFLPNINLGKEITDGLSPEGGPPYLLPSGIINYYKEPSNNYPSYMGGGDAAFVDYYFWNNLMDNTKIDGCFQKIKYIEDRKNEVVEWLQPNLKIEDYSSENICVINFRGKDYLSTNSWLPYEYYFNAIEQMLKINPRMEFVIVTDDPENAKKFIPLGDIVSSFDEIQPEISSQSSQDKTAKDYSIMINAKYLILSASTFCFWAAFGNKQCKKIIAPKYWFDFQQSNGWWRGDDNIMDEWFYLDRNNNLLSGAECKKEYEIYKKQNIFYKDK